MVSLTHRPPLPGYQEYSWYSFSLGAESTPGPWFGRKEKSSDTTGNRSRDRPTSSANNNNNHYYYYYFKTLIIIIPLLAPSPWRRRHYGPRKPLKLPPALSVNTTQRLLAVKNLSFHLSRAESNVLLLFIALMCSGIRGTTAKAISQCDRRQHKDCLIIMISDKINYTHKSYKVAKVT